MHRAVLASAFVLAASATGAQDAYKLPPQEVVDIVDAPPPPGVRASPDARVLLIVERPALPPIAEVARPWIGLAGLRIDPARNAPQQVAFDRALTLMDVATGAERRIALPSGARIAGASFSHTSRHVAITIAEDERVDLWVADVDTAEAWRVATGLNTILGGFDWMPDGVRLLVRLVPESRGAAPQPPRAPAGPTTMETSGKKSPARTFQDLLTDEHDARLFEHYALAQLAIIDPRDGSLSRIGAPALYAWAQAAPDGRHVLVERVHRPFSYTLPLDRFPRAYEVWSAAGELVRLVADLPLADQVPIEGVPMGPRNIRWRAGEPATLVWVEALDGGDPKTRVPHRDRWMSLAAPFAGQAQELFRVEHRAFGLTWFEDPALVLATDFDRDRRWIRATLHDLSGARAPVVLEDRSLRDRYGNPGSIVTRVRPDGTRVARQEGEWIFREGDGDDPAGARPFLDRQSVVSCASERLWRCESGVYESVVAIASSAADRAPAILTRRESQTEPPNVWSRDLATAQARQLTRFPDPTPSIRGVKKQLVTYAREDGVQLSATMYTPAGHERGTRLPLVVWAYPLEYNDAATAGQVSGSPHRFTQIGGPSHLLFLTQGYAVMDDATMPIVGDPETMNDTFVEQIAMSAEAAIAKAAEMGIADPSRAGVGGHSYGAFMTANLLAHTDLFRAGVARSGAYNRTLTPFGFQSERRPLWEARGVYQALSPFLHAEKIGAPLLLIHGEKDSNPGTFPMQSERLYQAIAGLGGTARLVILPEESHGYRARESVLHTVAEMLEWFDRHVKGARSVGAVEASVETKGD
jgi:dipeptidyl aminopeptidase/acylaminoacyl peptidase